MSQAPSKLQNGIPAAAEAAEKPPFTPGELEKLLKLDTKIGAVSADKLKLMSRLEAGLTMARTIAELHREITPEMLTNIMPLMNSPLGFRTDRPSKKNPTLYGVDVVRSVLIEALIRGLRLVGNEVNIISDRMYITKEGFTRLISEYPGLSNLTLGMSVPAMTDSGAIVRCRATWMIGGVVDSLEREIPIRVNEGMGADAILGKAERKLRAAIYNKLTGSAFLAPDGEIDPDLVISIGADALAETAAPSLTQAIDSLGAPSGPVKAPIDPGASNGTPEKAPITTEKGALFDPNEIASMMDK